MPLQLHLIVMEVAFVSNDLFDCITDFKVLENCAKSGAFVSGCPI
jgi:hypothetical protein